MIANTLMHREFTSSYAAKFIIQKEKMYVENASRATREGFITPENLEPNPKNPIIASFFRNIGRADRLGSGVRNLFKYSKFYSGKEPEFREGDVFRIIVPLDDEFSFDFGLKTGAIYEKTDAKLTKTESEIVKAIRENPAVTQNQIAARLGLSNSGVRYSIRGLKEKGILERSGSSRRGEWILHMGHE